MKNFFNVLLVWPLKELVSEDCHFRFKLLGMGNSYKIQYVSHHTWHMHVIVQGNLNGHDSAGHIESSKLWSNSAL